MQHNSGNYSSGKTKMKNIRFKQEKINRQLHVSKITWEDCVNDTSKLPFKRLVIFVVLWSLVCGLVLRIFSRICIDLTLHIQAWFGSSLPLWNNQNVLKSQALFLTDFLLIVQIQLLSKLQFLNHLCIVLASLSAIGGKITQQYVTLTSI